MTTIQIPSPVSIVMADFPRALSAGHRRDIVLMLYAKGKLVYRYPHEDVFTVARESATQHAHSGVALTSSDFPASTPTAQSPIGLKKAPSLVQLTRAPTIHVGANSAQLCFGISAESLLHMFSATFSGPCEVRFTPSIFMLVIPLMLGDASHAYLTAAVCSAAGDPDGMLLNFLVRHCEILTREEQHFGYLSEQCQLILESPVAGDWPSIRKLPGCFIAAELDQVALVMGGDSTEDIIVNHVVTLPSSYLTGKPSFPRRLLTTYHRQRNPNAIVTLARGCSIDFPSRLERHYVSYLGSTLHQRLSLYAIRDVLSQLRNPPWRLGVVTERLAQKLSAHSSPTSTLECSPSNQSANHERDDEAFFLVAQVVEFLTYFDVLTVHNECLLFTHAHLCTHSEANHSACTVCLVGKDFIPLQLMEGCLFGELCPHCRLHRLYTTRGIDPNGDEESTVDDQEWRDQACPVLHSRIACQPCTSRSDPPKLDAPSPARSTRERGSPLSSNPALSPQKPDDPSLPPDSMAQCSEYLRACQSAIEERMRLVMQAASAVQPSDKEIPVSELHRVGAHVLLYLMWGKTAVPLDSVIYQHQMLMRRFSKAMQQYTKTMQRYAGQSRREIDGDGTATTMPLSVEFFQRLNLMDLIRRYNALPFPRFCPAALVHNLVNLLSDVVAVVPSPSDR